MRLLDRYLLTEWLKIFALAMIAMLAVLLLENLYDQLGDLLGFGTRPSQILKYYLLLLPAFLPTVLPLSQFVSLLFALGNLHRHNEIIALRAAGLSLWRIARPLWLAGAVIAGLLGWLNASLVPWSIEQSRLYYETLRYTAEAREHPADEVGVVRQLTYNNLTQHRLWFFNQFSDYAWRGQGIYVYELDAQGHNQRQIRAGEGYFDDAAGHWVFLKGRELLFDPDDGQVNVSRPFDEKAFPELTENPSLMITLRQRAGDLSLGELRTVLAQAPAAENPSMNVYAVRYHAILASPFLGLVIVGLAVPFAVSGVRVNPMVGVSKAVGLLFIYYLVSNLCALLGNQQHLPPMLAAWLPILLMLGWGVGLFRRAI